MARSDHSAAGDAHGRGEPRGVREGIVLVAIGIVLLGVAAWSASRSTIGDSSPDIPADVGANEAVLNDALLVTAGALVAAAVIFVAPAFMRHGRARAARGADDDEPRTQLWLRLLGGVTVILAIALLVLLAARNRPSQTTPLSVAPATTEQVQPTAGEERAGARGWSATALFAAGALAVGTAVLLWHRRGRARGSIDLDDDRVPPQPSAPLDLEALAPADAVRAAYAAARNALEHLGVSARAPETPYEYLDRVRAIAPIVERPITTLTRLFEVARFSHHPVSPAMKTEAIAAYTIVAHEATRAREAAQERDAEVLA